MLLLTLVLVDAPARTDHDVFDGERGTCDRRWTAHGRASGYHAQPKFTVDGHQLRANTPGCYPGEVFAIRRARDAQVLRARG